MLKQDCSADKTILLGHTRKVMLCLSLGDTSPKWEEIWWRTSREFPRLFPNSASPLILRLRLVDAHFGLVVRVMRNGEKIAIQFGYKNSRLRAEASRDFC
jgi:hypothetical protein